jgi:hypothetical protein
MVAVEKEAARQKEQELREHFEKLDRANKTADAATPTSV